MYPCPKELTEILLVVLVIICHAFRVLLVSHALHQQQVHVLMVPLVYKERTRVILVNPDHSVREDSSSGVHQGKAKVHMVQLYVLNALLPLHMLIQMVFMK